jgi:hypothetical protein
MRMIRRQIRTFLADWEKQLPGPPSESAERIGELRRRLTDNAK